MSDIRATFVSQPGHHTRAVLLSYPATARPETLLHDLRKIGWKELSPTADPPEDGRLSCTVHKRGHRLFGGWSRDERPLFMREMRRVLRRHGIDCVERQTAADTT